MTIQTIRPLLVGLCWVRGYEGEKYTCVCVLFFVVSLPSFDMPASI